ncbi:MAG: 1-deoxy-D-xylulose-5-phosphate synthase [bacterium]|nr:1-deoxy-D-xylulose-5-phosphate synthase [bacterium]
MILDKVNYPKDLKNLSISELNCLADEIRDLIIKKVNVMGGHMAPNLGFIEATIAMHYVFDAPKDKMIFDVSHQCYTHKILTGRKNGFLNPEDYLKYTGYTAPEESEYDLFKVGHTSTSVSLATGVAKVRDLENGRENVIAILGDGSLSGGEALEGLNNAAAFKSNFIVILNDNDMSIAENQGGMYDNLRVLRETDGKAENNLFKTFGFDYCFLKDGNNIEKLIETFKNVKDINHPIVVHICTQKGHGLEVAEKNKEFFHFVMPRALEKKDDTNAVPQENYTSLIKEYLYNRAKTDNKFVIINAATPGVFGFTPDFRKELGEQYTDVGIAEEHAIAFSSAVAKCGAKPVFTVMSSFVQRTYDQLSQDLCLNKSPITMLVYWGGISDADSTHLCVFDIPLISNIPNMVYLAPTCKEELIGMLNWSISQTDHPVAIRVPSGDIKVTDIEDKTNYAMLNKYSLENKGEKVAIIGLGNFLELAQKTAELINKNLGFMPTIINPKYITGIDTVMLEKLKENHKIVITLEDGVLNGGFGEKISRYLGNSDIKVLNYGAEKEFTDRVPIEDLYKRYRLTPEQICEDITKLIND